MKVFTPEEHEAWLKGLPGLPAGAAMILENPDGKLLVVKAGYKDYWTMPGGVIDEGESPKEAALREASEEVGLVVEPSLAQFVSAAYRHSPIRDTYQFVFSAPISNEQAAAIRLQESEIEDYAFVTKAQVLSGDRPYAWAVTDWANGHTGYSEVGPTS